MQQKGVSRQEGTMMVEHHAPGTGGRHRATRTYGKQPDMSLNPREQLAWDIANARTIYQKDGAYTPEIRQSLQEVVERKIV